MRAVCCAASGRLNDRRNISLTHANATFKDEIQADFSVVNLRGENQNLLNIIDTRTRYGERIIFPTRSAAIMTDAFMAVWLCRHGAPKHFSSDHELCRSVLRWFMEKFGVKMHSRP